ncbi:diguanylate cyclase (GGDEF)-like protein [Nakamurella sp. UYEF19]|uniref:putative bifunctional diguanylate cyclase/phosphodiesterase n=1 Tax=Nakamurella sp. UYEF19 TaxID=1756392 RepID=UPI0033933619
MSARTVTHGARPSTVALAAGAVLVVASIVSGFVDPDQPLIRNITQLIAAAGAALTCWRTSRSTGGRMRSSWSAIALGCAAWAIGQLVYTLLSIRTPESALQGPTVADIGFILFPVGAFACLLLFPPSGGKSAVIRSSLDGCALLAALVAISWPIARSAYEQGGADTHGALGLIKTIAYPSGDVLIIALAFFSVSRPTRHRVPLLLLAAGVSLITLADAAFATATGPLPDVGFVTAFLALAYAAGTGGRMLALDRARGASPTPSQTPGASMLPYLPLAVAIGTLSLRAIGSEPPGHLEIAAVAVAVVAVLIRQYLTVLDNRQLLEEVAEREERLRRQAFQDQLTGLANRALFTDRVAHALHLHRRDLRPLGLLFCDLDDFKAVNDTLGHAAGDQMLIRVAERLRGALREGDTLARFGGDEFAVLLEDGSEPTLVATRIIDALREPFVVNDTTVNVGVSVGVTDLDGKTAIPTLDELLAHADVAMYSAKRSGKGQLALYEPSMVLPAAVDLKLREPLRVALRTGKIHAVYQPIIDLADGRMSAVETLARWMHDGLQVSPVEFVPMAGRAGLLAQLTDHMLDEACAQLARWTRLYGDRGLKIGVNIPPQLIIDLDFPNRVAAMLAKHSVRPEQLILEITEDALLGDLTTARTVTARLRRIGASLSLDDFGTGYSSLLHLQQIPLDALKIDISFVANIDRDAEGERFLRAFLALGKDLGLAVTAEGVEREEQAQTLRRLGCPTAQGFLFARPGPAADLESTLLQPGAVWKPASTGSFRPRRGAPGRI